VAIPRPKTWDAAAILTEKQEYSHSFQATEGDVMLGSLLPGSKRALGCAPARRACAVVLALLTTTTSPAWAGDPGVDNDAIVFGEPAPFSGPAAELGLKMRIGILAAFAEVNRRGGVNGRQLKLVSYDDGYDPEQSIEATRRLIDEDKVFALIGPVGTPTSAATEPMAANAGLPFIGALTGAEFLRDPRKDNVVNIRASYFEETETLVDRLTTDRGYSRIAVLYQDDAFGRAGLTGVENALARRGMMLAGQASFERNTTAVKMATLALRQTNPQAVIMIGPYRPCAEFVRLSRRLGMDAQFAAISFLNSDAFAKDLGALSVGTIVTQTVPSPFDASLSLVSRFQDALKQYDAMLAPGYVALEGYLAGRLTIAALEKISGEPTRAALLSAIRPATFDLGGMTLAYGPADNRGSRRVFLTTIESDGATRPIANLTEPHG
jgi:branched-chain amino acid transport system substrate-binding protein